jgi:hypothetical protein
MTVLWILWLILTAIVIGLALYRKFVSHFREDDLLHLAEGEAKLIPGQAAVARSLDRIDFWGKTLTVADAVFGLILLAISLYEVYQHSLQKVP